MRVQLANSILRSEKWTEEKIHDVAADTAEDAAYAAVRKTHEFLTDENHSWEAGEREISWGGKLSRFNSLRVYRYQDRQGFWFSVEYRVLQ